MTADAHLWLTVPEEGGIWLATAVRGLERFDASISELPGA
jgi:hypothetical protein